MKKIFVALLFVGCVLGMAPAQLFARSAPQRAHVLALINVTLIDMRSDRPQPHRTVLIAGERIARIGRNIRVPADAEVVDAGGRFLIPGLWDNYTFTLEAAKNGFPFFDLMVAHGVTGVRDSGTGMDLVAASKLRADIEAGRVIAPRLYYAGTVLQGEMPPRRSGRWTGISTIVTSAAGAKRAVEALIAAGADYIKVEKRTSPAILKKIIRTAHRLNRRVVAVPPSFVMDASNDGLDCVEHLAELFRETSKERDAYYALYRDHTIDSMTTDQNYAFFGTMTTDQPYYAATLEAMARNRTCAVTNLSQTATFIGDFELVDDTRLRFKNEEQVKARDAAVAERQRQIATNDYRMVPANRERHLREIVDLHRAGVRILAGTQSSADSTGTAGLILHDELALLVRAGLTPFDALKSATIDPARFMRRERDLGTIERGKLADLVLLDANPLADISNTRRISAVILNGRLLRRSALDDMLSRAEATAKSKQ